MSDNNIPSGTPTQPPAGAQQVAVPITIVTQYLKDLSFENPNAPGILSFLSQTQPDVNINVNITTQPLQATSADMPPAYECALTLKADAKLNGQSAFIVECNYAGVFAFPPGVPEQIVRAMLMIEAPRLLFPFARAIVAECAQNGGYGPLLVNPVDFAGLYQRQLQLEAAEQSSQQVGNA